MDTTISFQRGEYTTTFDFSPDDEDRECNASYGMYFSLRDGDRDEHEYAQTILNLDQAEYLAHRLLDWVAYQRQRYLDTHPNVREELLREKGL